MAIQTTDSALVGRRVLVTGAAGFIGAQLCQRCVAVGAAVFGVSRIERADAAQGVRWRRADLGDLADVRRVVRDVRPDYVFDLAGDSRAARGVEMVTPTLQGNLIAPLNLMTAVTELPGCRRVVLVGSQEEPQADVGPSAVASSPYAAAKHAMSLYAAMFHRLYETPIAVARVFMVYGPGQRDARKLIPSVALGLLRGESPALSSGERRVDWVHVDDVAAGLVAVAVARDVDGRTFDLGSGALHSVRQIAERIASMIPEARGKLLVGALPDRPMEQERAADVEATFAAIDWRPGVGLEEGLRQTVDWYREHLPEFA